MEEMVMRINQFIFGTSVAAVIVAASVTYSALAWHPSGKIIKEVQNVTSGSALSDADSLATAVAAKPGDTLRYVIAVSNNGNPDKSGNNDMAKTVMTDTLPDGVALISDPSQRQITENMGTIKPGQTVTKEYLAKVTASTDGSITNTACFTGNSTVNDNPQKGCNPAVVNITVPVVVPPVTVTPVTPTTPVTPVVPQSTPAELPHTGPAESILGTIVALGAISYVINDYVMSRRELSKLF